MLHALSAKDPKTDLLWSRHGLQEVVGYRGTLYTATAIPEAANFQSNLDHHPLTIDRQLMDIFTSAVKYSGMTFIRLHANTPHVHARSMTKYPLSRVITTCGLHNPNHTRKILQKARSYVDHMNDLARKTICRTHARVEAVFLLKGHFPLRLDAKDFYNPTAIHQLLEENPMLLPFRDNGPHS